MDKTATTDHPIHPSIAARWSPRAFDASELSEADLRSILEAARWAASCFNEQPWRFIVALRQEKERFGAVLACLTETNQSWAKNAGALVVTLYRTRFSHNDKPNRHAMHDLGLAMGQLTQQAGELGLHVHHMAGFSQDAVREAFDVPEDVEIATVVAIGRQADPSVLPDPLAEKERTPRSRKPQSELVFSDKFNQVR